MTQSTHHPLRLGHATLLPKSAALWTIVLTAIALAAPSQAQQLPNLAGTYRCEPEPSPCQNGQTFTVSQSGNKLDFKDERSCWGRYDDEQYLGQRGPDMEYAWDDFAR